MWENIVLMKLSMPNDKAPSESIIDPIHGIL